MGKRGPPPRIDLDRENPHKPVFIGLAESRSRKRVTISRPGAETVSWLKDSTATDTLVELAHAGQAILRDWKIHGEKILELRRSYLSVGNLEGVLALDERFLRLTIESGQRIPISERLAAHLGLTKANFQIYIVALPDRVELWSNEFRLQEREQLSDYIPEFD